MTTIGSGARLESVHALRGIAALLVVLYHFNTLAGTSWEFLIPFIAKGNVGVDIFFVISGVVIARAAQHNPAPLRFAYHRLVRVVPLYFLATLYVIYPYGSLNEPRVWQALLFLPSGSEPPFYGYPPLYVGWSLNFEMYFYLILTAALFFRRNALAITAITVLGIVAVRQISGGSSLLDAYSTNPILPLYLDMAGNPIVLEFCMGMGIWWLHSTGRRVPKVIAGLISAGLLAYFVWAFSPLGLWGHGPALLGTPAAALVLALVIIEAHFGFPKFKSVGLLGDMSYSLYLVHPLVFYALDPILPDSGIRVMLALAAASITIAFAVHVMVETPIARMARLLEGALWSRSRATAAGRETAASSP